MKNWITVCATTVSILSFAESASHDLGSAHSSRLPENVQNVPYLQLQVQWKNGDPQDGAKERTCRVTLVKSGREDACVLLTSRRCLRDNQNEPAVKLEIPGLGALENVQARVMEGTHAADNLMGVVFFSGSACTRAQKIRPAEVASEPSENFSVPTHRGYGSIHFAPTSQYARLDFSQDARFERNDIGAGLLSKDASGAWKLSGVLTLLPELGSATGFFATNLDWLKQALELTPPKASESKPPVRQIASIPSRSSELNKASRAVPERLLPKRRSTPSEPSDRNIQYQGNTPWCWACAAASVIEDKTGQKLSPAQVVSSVFGQPYLTAGSIETMRMALERAGVKGSGFIPFPQTLQQLATLVAPENGGSKIVITGSPGPGLPAHAMVIQKVTDKGYVRLSDSRDGKTYDVRFEQLLAMRAEGLIGTYQ